MSIIKITNGLILGETFNAGYVRVNPDPEAKVFRTIEVSEALMVDVDEDGRPIGIEYLGNSDWQSALIELAMQGRVIIT